MLLHWVFSFINNIKESWVFKRSCQFFIQRKLSLTAISRKCPWLLLWQSWEVFILLQWIPGFFKAMAFMIYFARSRALYPCVFKFIYSCERVGTWSLYLRIIINSNRWFPYSFHYKCGMTRLPSSLNPWTLLFI